MDYKIGFKINIINCDMEKLPIIKVGSKGSLVKRFQQKANISPADGIFGNGTKAAVMQLQKTNGLNADGVVGSATWAFVMSNVKNYSSQEIISRVIGLDSYKYIPKGYWIVGVRSNEDSYNEFDDKFFLMLNDKIVTIATGTTHSGGYGLLNFAKWNKNGTGVVKSDEIYYGLYQKSDGKNVRHHKGKQKCLRMVKPVKHYRDGNKNKKVEEIGKIYVSNIHANFHTNSHSATKGVVNWAIGGWSTACQVINDISKYYEIIDTIPYNTLVSYCLLKEW